VCGIVGFIGEPGIDQRLMQRMCEAIRHRGPDEEGSLLRDNVALGMRRLAIIDLESGRQPIFNEDGTIAIVYNGEAYNFPELRKFLEDKGHRFRTSTDTECVVHLYEEYGDRCVEHLRGMFAFALWDAKRERLLLARDRVGKKPLFYRLTSRGIWFASELKSLVQDSSFPRSVDTTALHHYLTYLYVPAPWSIYEGVQKLPPAHTLSYENGRTELRRYWKLSYRIKRRLTEQEALDELRQKLKEAVRIRLLSDRPVGAFLSGGVDSSIVVALMSELASGPVKTFSIGFEEAAFDERPFARKVANRFGCDHREFVVRPSASEILPEITWHYDEPFADSSAIPSYYLAKLTRNFVTVALNGDGGDESFGGYPRYLGRMAMDGWTKLLRPLSFTAPVMSTVGRRASRGSKLAYLGRFLEALGAGPKDSYASMISCFQNNQKKRLYSPALNEQLQSLNSWSIVADLFEASDAVDLLDKMLDVDVQSYLPGDLLVKMDLATMANSLEARSPFLDQQVMQLAAALPPDMKVRGHSKKILLKKLGETMLPGGILDRKKMGFVVPISMWLRGELRDMMCDLLLDSTAKSRGYFNPGYVRGLVERHISGTDHSQRLWALLQFELWHRMFIDDLATSAPHPVQVKELLAP
jgi:asparagine synthase (glutamine-hydrolysing)